MTLSIESGWGYWDVTYYPYGGCFKRASESTPLISEVIETFTKRGETKVKLTDKSIAVVKTRAIIEVGQPVVIEDEIEQARR